MSRIFVALLFPGGKWVFIRSKEYAILFSAQTTPLSSNSNSMNGALVM